MNLLNNHISEVKITWSRRIPEQFRKKFTSSSDAYDMALNIWPEGTIDHSESFMALMLDRASKYLCYSIISIGGLSGTVADPKKIFQTALKANASCLILIHNHPSGNKDPSDADNKLTKKLKSAGEFLDLSVLDHLIITSDGYFSYADEGEF